MNLILFFLVILSALFHSLWHIGLKTEKNVGASGFVLAAFSCAIAIVASIGHWESALKPETVCFTILGGLLSGGALAFIGLSFKGGSLGLAYTVSRAGSVLILWPVSYLFLNETVTWANGTGAFLLTFSIVWIMLETQHEHANRYLWWALASAACIAGYGYVYKKALRAGADPIALLGWSDTVRVAITFLLLGKSRARDSLVAFKTAWKKLFALGVLNFLSFGIFLYALQFSGAAQVVTLRNLSIVFTAIGASRMGELLSTRARILILLATLGACLVGLK